MNSTDKVAVITGAGSGIGKATALALLKDGWCVAFAGRRQDALDAALAEAGSDASRGLAVATDVGDPQAVTALFEKVQKRFGRLDMLFNNAGQNAPGVPFEDLPYDKWKSVVERQPQRLLPLRTGSLPHDEGAEPAGWPHH